MLRATVGKDTREQALLIVFGPGRQPIGVKVNSNRQTANLRFIRVHGPGQFRKGKEDGI